MLLYEKSIKLTNEYYKLSFEDYEYFKSLTQAQLIYYKQYFDCCIDNMKKKSYELSWLVLYNKGAYIFYNAESKEFTKLSPYLEKSEINYCGLLLSKYKDIEKESSYKMKALSTIKM